MALDDIPEVGSKQKRALGRAGINSVEDLAAAHAKEVSKKSLIPEAKVAAMIAAAREQVGAPAEAEPESRAPAVDEAESTEPDVASSFAAADVDPHGHDEEVRVLLDLALPTATIEHAGHAHADIAVLTLRADGDAHAALAGVEGDVVLLQAGAATAHAHLHGALRHDLPIYQYGAGYDEPLRVQVADVLDHPEAPEVAPEADKDAAPQRDADPAATAAEAAPPAAAEAPGEPEKKSRLPKLRFGKKKD